MNVCVCVCVCVCAGIVLEPLPSMVWLLELSYQYEIRELHNTCSEIQISVTECFLLVSYWAVNIKNRFYFTVNLPLLSTVCFYSVYSVFRLRDPNGTLCKIHSIHSINILQTCNRFHFTEFWIVPIELCVVQAQKVNVVVLADYLLTISS